MTAPAAWSGFVYAGDNVLWKMRGPGSASSTPAELDQEIGTGQEYGAIGYTHAGGVDRPLAAYKRGVNAAVIVPHTNWRGQFSGGTYLQGSQSTAPVSWPGYSTTAWYQGKPPQEQNRVYMGTVLEGQRDASGQMYMRNRMYDPATGQFTQTDPIGIAGGLNTYGFAAGDPVSYSDPYGLSPEIGENEECIRCLLRAGRALVRPFAARAARRAARSVDDLIESANRAGIAPRNLPNPPTPGSISNAQFGDIMKWGRGTNAARERIGALTREELERGGVTREIAQQWRDFYVNEVRLRPNNPSARGRAELMHKALELLR